MWTNKNISNKNVSIAASLPNFFFNYFDLKYQYAVFITFCFKTNLVKKYVLIRFRRNI